MPRNNSPARKAQRRNVAATRAERHKLRHAQQQRQQDMNYLAVIRETAEILEAEGRRLNIIEIETQRRHLCGKPDTCTLNPKTCSMLNQNMPPDRIVGQQD